MIEVISIEVVLRRVKELMSQYEAYCKEHIRQNPEAEGKSFGEWVMTTHYPNIDYSNHRDLRDMITTPRTSDARTYLIANLRNGTLPL